MADDVTVGDSVIDSLGEIAISLGESAIELDIPFLAIPGVRTMFEALVSWIGGKIIAALKESASIGIIDFGENANNEAAKAAALRLYAVQANPDASENDLISAKEEFKSAYKALIVMRKSTPK